MTRTSTFAAAALCAAVLAPGSVLAQGAENWEFKAAIYGYFPTIGGTGKFRPSGSGGSASVDIDTILDNLKFTFMGQFEARKDEFGVFTDLVYMDVGADKSGTRAMTIGERDLPVGASASASYDMKGWLWTLAGTYRAITTPNYQLDVVAGARLLDIEQKLGFSLAGNIGSIPVADRAGQGTADLANWDAIVGVKGRASFGEDRRWFVPYYVDIGAGESKFTWQAIAGIGYQFDWGGLVAAWRYIDYDMKSGKSLEDLNFNGPGIAVVFSW